MVIFEKYFENESCLNLGAPQTKLGGAEGFSQLLLIKLDRACKKLLYRLFV
jgi:hypothetical protein